MLLVEPFSSARSTAGMNSACASSAGAESITAARDRSACFRDFIMAGNEL